MKTGTKNTSDYIVGIFKLNNLNTMSKPKKQYVAAYITGTGKLEYVFEVSVNRKIIQSTPDVSFARRYTISGIAILAETCERNFIAFETDESTSGGLKSNSIGYSFNGFSTK